jgi:CubicO group peptidase (beta-lactamase class C family)
MYKTILVTITTLVLLVSYSQEDKGISSIENNLTNKIHIKGAIPKTYSILQKMEEYKIPGVSIAIARKGQLVYAKGFGIANSNSGSKVNENTLFQAASISKPLAALSVLKLVDEGKVDLDTDVNTYLKEWKVPENRFTKDENVTLRRILTHTAGITVHGFRGYKPKEDFPSTIDVLNGLGNSPLITVDTIPGSIWRYSGGGYTIMQQLIKDVSGIELDEYMDKYIFPEIVMHASSFQQPIEETKAIIASGAYDEKGKLIKGMWHNYPEIAAAGLWTTPTDLIKYCLYIQKVYSGKIEGVLTKEVVTKMLTPNKNGWGLGPVLKNEGDSLLFGHSGKNKGFTNILRAFANKGDAIVVMTNGDNGGRIIDDIIRAVSTYYSWGISKQITVIPVSIDEKELAKLTGKYYYMQGGQREYIKAKLKKGHIVLTDPQAANDFTLTPISKFDFIDLENGITIDFRTNENGEIIDFLWNKKWAIIKEE